MVNTTKIKERFCYHGTLISSCDICKPKKKLYSNEDWRCIHGNHKKYCMFCNEK